MPKKLSSAADTQPVRVAVIERRIYLIRDHKVMIDSDLAELYNVETFNLNKAVKRNLERFPRDFMFQLTKAEADALRFQIGMSKVAGRGGRRYLPYVFTEQGVAMLSSVLRSKRAIQVNVAIMRAFVRLREILATHKDLAREMVDLNRRQKAQGAQIEAILEAIEQLVEAPEPERRPIGFVTRDKDK
jgi:phage regulator Rha-like protein